MDGIEVIVHCATQAIGNKDVVAADHLFGAARRAGVAHIIYVSIVGIDAIPLPYYKTKLRVEELWPRRAKATPCYARRSFTT